MNFKELYSIREWAPLTDVLDRIPTRIKRGLLPENLSITCIDAAEDFLALGTNAGIIYWYNRTNGEIQELKTESIARITCVKIVNSVEYMVAAGNSVGHVNVFQIQKELHPELNLVAPCTKSKPTQRYVIKQLHKSGISCCEWSKNAIKLYTGDRNGVVVQIEIDYQAHVSKSLEILSEAYEIVQLSVHRGYLLVSTLYRSIVCHNDNNGIWTVTQVGKHDRKQLVDCGGTFFKQSSTINNKSLRLISGRPNFRFWVADIEGIVEKTLLFRETVRQSPTWQIPILNPKFSMPTTSSITYSRNTKGEESAAISGTRNFRNLYSYAQEDALIVTHDEKDLYVLNIDQLRVEAVAKDFRKIVDFCVCNKEIFVLEGERSILRLAPSPEKPMKSAKIIYNPSLPPPVPNMGSSACGSFEAPVEYEPEQQSITNAEECVELPAISNLNLQIPIELAVESPRAEQKSRLEVLKEISETDFDDDNIVHSRKLLKTRKKRATDTKNYSGIVEIGHEFTAFSTKTDASFCSNELEESNLSFEEKLSKYLPKKLSPETLAKKNAADAKSLAEELNLPEVCLKPITDEDLRRSKHLSQPPAPQPPKPLSPLATAYPIGNIFKDTSIQTTPQKKIYYIEEKTIKDFTDGQPVEDVCHNLRATTLIESENIEEEEVENMLKQKKVTADHKINTQTEDNDEIDSFLFDFKRAKDPLSKTSANQNRQHTYFKMENDTGNSSSSDWEFLDN